MGMYNLFEDQEQRIAELAEACLYIDYLHRNGKPQFAPPIHAYPGDLRDQAIRHAKAMLAITLTNAGGDEPGEGEAR